MSDNPQDTPVGSSDPTKIPLTSMSNDFPMSADRTDKVVTEHVAYQGDLATRRKAYVSGVLKNDSFLYSSKASTAGGAGVVTFYITDNGASGGSAVFANVYSDSVAVSAYGSSGNYQAYNLTVAGDKKSVTATIGQITNVLGIATIAGTAANGIECRLYVMGD